jgi:hypothetical protein
MAVRQHAPGGQHRLARLPQMQPLGDAVDKQVDHFELGQIAAGKRVVLRPQPLRDLAHRRAGEQGATVLVGKQRFNVACRQPARYISTASASNSSVRPRMISRSLERNGTARSQICGAAYSTTPSAVFSRPRR